MTVKMVTAVSGHSSINLNPKDQFRLVTSLRADYYQVPFDPNPNSPPSIV